MSNNYRQLYYNNLYIDGISAKILDRINAQIEEQNLKDTQDGADFKSINKVVDALLSNLPYDVSGLRDKI
jgi:hypothetical protein